MAASAVERAVTAVMVQLQIQYMLTVPIKDPDFDVQLSFFISSNYDAPTTFNSSNLPESIDPVEVMRRITREKRYQRPVLRDQLYHAAEILLESKTSSRLGRACLLRSICEAAAWPLQHDGLVGELLHVLLTPSTTVENGALHSDYLAAERLGRRGVDCGSTFPACPSSPLDLVSTLSREWG